MKKRVKKKSPKASSQSSSLNNINASASGGKSLQIKVTAKELLNFPVIGDAIMPKENIYYDYICNKNKRMKNKMREIKPTSRNEPKVSIFNKISELRTKIDDNHDLVSSYSSVIHEARKAIDEITVGYDKLKGTERNESGTLIRPDPMEDLIKEYHNRKVKLPHFRSIDKENLFKQNPLLQIGSDIQKYYMFYREKPVERNVNRYLRKINCFYNQKIIPNPTERELQRVLNQNKEIEDSELAQVQKPIDVLKERDDIKKEVQFLKKTIDEIESMDEFYMTRRKRFEGVSRNVLHSSTNLKDCNKSDEQSRGGLTASTTRKISSYPKLKKLSCDSLNSGSTYRLLDNKHLSIDYLYHECSSNSIYKNDFSELIKDYAKSNNINVSSKSTNEALINHLKQLRKSVLVRNFIMEDYNIRRDKNQMLELSTEQKKVLKKNRAIEQDIRRSEDQTLRIILKQNVDE